MKEKEHLVFIRSQEHSVAHADKGSLYCCMRIRTFCAHERIRTFCAHKSSRTFCNLYGYKIIVCETKNMYS